MIQTILLRSLRFFVRLSPYLVITILTAFMLAGCETTSVRPTGQYDHGGFVVNEGQFGHANGTISFQDPTGNVNENIFRNTAGDFAGDAVLSLYFTDDAGFVVINGDSKIEVVNPGTFKGKYTIADPAIDKPRYLVVENNKAYISVWGAYDANYSLVDSYVLVWDLNKNEMIGKIDTDEGTEELLLSGGVLFASNFNYGASHTVALIDPDTDELIDQLEVASGPSGMVEDAEGKVWVICIGDYDAGNGALVRIDPATRSVVKTVPLGYNVSAGNPNLALSRKGDAVVYMIGNNVYYLPVESAEAPDSPLFTATDVIQPYALGVDPDNGDIWIGDALDYTSAGKVYIYSSSGEAVTSFGTGISPTQFVFK